MQRICLFIFLIITFLSCQPKVEQYRIDRKALVMRNNVMVEGFDSLASLSVGNGDFAFTTDLTGLQTFYQEYEKGVPLGTQSNWGWHTYPNSEKFELSETTKFFEHDGRQIPYRHQLKDTPRSKAASNYFRENAQRLHLGMIGLVLIKENGEKAALTDIKNAHHSLDMWHGKIVSDFEFEGEAVRVEVYCHQDTDLIAVRIHSRLIEQKKLSVQWSFSAGVTSNTHPGYDYNSPEKHQSVIEKSGSNVALINRYLDNDFYQLALNWKGNALLSQTEDHNFILQPKNGEELEFCCLFSRDIKSLKVCDFEETETSNHKEWLKFWNNGGVVDFSQCTDERAKELERRTVLSQYLTKIQSSGALPPAETGLTYNSWYGKFHLEMHWWHIAHFMQWQRASCAENQLDYYNKIYAVSRQTAKEQGYKGVRWPKMIGPDGVNSPSSVGSYLIWQQPHVIWFAEQMYQQYPTEETLEKYKNLVFATADFMSDFPVWNAEEGRYNLEAPLIPAQEHWSREKTKNPPFELAYWYWGLTTAQKWKERLGIQKDEKWEDVRLKIASPDTANGVYLGVEGAVDSYNDIKYMRDHPVVLGAYGILPAWDKIDPEIMRNTMKVIAKRWNWELTWGWDYPMSAMSAVRLNEPEMALDFLLKDVQKNTYLRNGHNYQSKRLRVYLPGNGGFLTTIGMMCAGWEGCELINPGFPKNGKWNVKWENISPVF